MIGAVFDLTRMEGPQIRIMVSINVFGALAPEQQWRLILYPVWLGLSHTNPL